MKFRINWALLAVAFSLCAVVCESQKLSAQVAEQELAATANQEEGFESLFDGETLEGWTGNPDLWSVEDGAITGTTTKDTKLKFNQFITWSGGEVADFELRVQFKIVGGNSGIQFRSKPFGEDGQFRVSGYQADIDATMRFMGILFEEKGRGILAQRSKQVTITEAGKKEVTGTTGTDEEIVAAIHENDWNEYVIRAKGNHITQTINGHKVVDVTDNQAEKAATSGILAFQIHVGPPMKVQFKNIRIKDLSEEE